MKKKHLILAIPFLVGFLIGYSSHFRSPGETLVERVDTLTVHDTIVRDLPVPVEVIKWKTVPEYLAVHDTTFMVDSILVDVPMERRIYQEDSLYRAVVSGYRPSLDSLMVYRTTTEITKFVPVPQRKRWGIGVQAGYGFSRQGISTYVGVGVSYNLINF